MSKLICCNYFFWTLSFSLPDNIGKNESFIRRWSPECESTHCFYTPLHLLKLAVIKQSSVDGAGTQHNRILLLDLLLLKSSRWWHSPPLNSLNRINQAYTRWMFVSCRNGQEKDYLKGCCHSGFHLSYNKTRV